MLTEWWIASDSFKCHKLTALLRPTFQLRCCSCSSAMSWKEKWMEYKCTNTESTEYLTLSPGTAEVKSSGYHHLSKDISKFSKETWSLCGSETNDPKNSHMD